MKSNWLNSPVDKGSNLLQLGLLAAEEPVRIGHIVYVDLGQSYNPGPLPVVVA